MVGQAEQRRLGDHLPAHRRRRRAPPQPALRSRARRARPAGGALVLLLADEGALRSGQAHRHLPRRLWLRALLHRILPRARFARSEEHTSELQSLMRISYAVFCLKKKKTNHTGSILSLLVINHYIY